jgi:hypothetical protein
MQMTLRRAPICIVHHGGSSEAHAVSLANRMYFISRYMPTIVDGAGAGTANKSTASAGSSLLQASTTKCAESSNLILLGHAQDNTWSRQHACSFPYVKFLRGGGFVLGGERYSDPTSGLVAVGADSKANRRLLLVLGVDDEGLARAVRNVPISSGPLTTDFAVYGPRAGWAGAGGLLAAGYVNHLWQVSNSAFAEPEPPRDEQQGGTASAGLLQDLSAWDRAAPADDEYLLGPNACSEQEAAALQADDEISGGLTPAGDSSDKSGKLRESSSRKKPVIRKEEPTSRDSIDGPNDPRMAFVETAGSTSTTHLQTAERIERWWGE